MAEPLTFTVADTALRSVLAQHAPEDADGDLIPCAHYGVCRKLAVTRSHRGRTTLGARQYPRQPVALERNECAHLGAAKGITASRVEAGAKKTQAADPSFPADLVKDDKGQVDIGDFQMLLVTMLAVVTFAASFWGFIGKVQYASVRCSA